MLFPISLLYMVSLVCMAEPKPLVHLSRTLHLIYLSVVTSAETWVP